MAYTSQADLITRFGLANITKWSDLDGTGTLNTARVQMACDHADAEINQALRGGGYSIPLIFQDAYAEDYVGHIANTIAAFWLYEARGLLDVDPQGNKLDGQNKAAYASLASIRAGWPRLACQRRWAPNPTGPGSF